MKIRLNREGGFFWLLPLIAQAAGTAGAAAGTAGAAAGTAAAAGGAAAAAAPAIAGGAAAAAPAAAASSAPAAATTAAATAPTAGASGGNFFSGLLNSSGFGGQGPADPSFGFNLGKNVGKFSLGQAGVGGGGGGGGGGDLFSGMFGGDQGFGQAGGFTPQPEPEAPNPMDMLSGMIDGNSSGKKSIASAQASGQMNPLLMQLLSQPMDASGGMNLFQGLV